MIQMYISIIKLKRNPTPSIQHVYDDARAGNDVYLIFINESIPYYALFFIFFIFNLGARPNK